MSDVGLVSQTGKCSVQMWRNVGIVDEITGSRM